MHTKSIKIPVRNVFQWQHDQVHLLLVLCFSVHFEVLYLNTSISPFDWKTYCCYTAKRFLGLNFWLKKCKCKIEFFFFFADQTAQHFLKYAKSAEMLLNINANLAALANQFLWLYNWSTFFWKHFCTFTSVTVWMRLLFM